MSYLPLVAACTALVYQLLAVVAALRQMLRPGEPQTWTPGISILKPISGRDPRFHDAIWSHARQDYPDFEILFGVSDADDPAIPEIERLIRDSPGVAIRLIHCASDAPNRKVGILEVLASEAHNEILLVNDSDITVPADYLRKVVAPLASGEIGVVTCLYRANADHRPARFEALGIATDFAPSVLVAPLVGVREFGLGSTLAFRAASLRDIGGFAALADYLADDYQLTKRISALGYRVHLSKTIVETTLSGSSWTEVWRHQVRWHRTIRVSKNRAYYGMVITQATLWAIIAASAGWWQVALATLGTRLAAGLLAGVGVLHCPLAGRLFWLMPARDLFGAAVWIAGLGGRTVEWRGRRLSLSPDGRILGEHRGPGF